MQTQKPVAQTFCVNAPASATIAVREVDTSLPAEAYPRINPKYVFNVALLRKVLFFLSTDGPRKNLMLVGDTGAGKSSLVEQIACRLGIPVFEIACSGKLRLANLVGGYSLSQGNTIWHDGPLTAAMRHGGIFLADEVTRMDHSEQMALAHALDCGTITVPDTGEIVAAAPGFRFIATGNSGGYGDESGAYNGEKVSSAAFLDRFQTLEVDYLPEDEERALLKSVAPSLGNEITGRMVSFATRVREAFVSRGGALRLTISTRSLVVWAIETVRYGDSYLSKTPIDEALADTILTGAPKEDRKVVAEIWSNWTV